MIVIGEKKAVICKGDFHPAALYKGDKKITGYSLEEFTGAYIVTLENCYNDKLYEVRASENVQSVSVRGKNYFDLDKVPFISSTTTPYNNGLKAMKSQSSNRGDKIPIDLPVGKTIYLTLDVVDSKIAGTTTRVTMGFYNSKNTLIRQTSVTATIAKKSYSFTLSEEVSYIQFYYQANNSNNAVGDYITMDNIMFRCEGNDTFELYKKPQTIPFENGEPTKDIPTFKGTTVIEADGTITGTYKKQEV